MLQNIEQHISLSPPCCFNPTRMLSPTSGSDLSIPSGHSYQQSRTTSSHSTPPRRERLVSLLDRLDLTARTTDVSSEKPSGATKIFSTPGMKVGLSVQGNPSISTSRSFGSSSAATGILPSFEYLIRSSGCYALQANYSSRRDFLADASEKLSFIARSSALYWSLVRAGRVGSIRWSI